MPKDQTQSPRDARILLFSQRNLSQRVWHSGPREFEDVIAEVEAVRIVAPQSRPVTRVGAVTRILANRARRRLGLALGADAQAVYVEGDYDLFFTVVTFASGLAALRQLKGWRQRCRKAVCFIFEQWLGNITTAAAHLELLADFDHVFVGSRWSIPALRTIARRPVDFMAAGIDAEAFCPYPARPPRTIDVYSLGRRSLVTHEALMQAMQAERLTYVYDSVSFGSVPWVDYAQHRPLVRHLMKRSRYFLVYKITDSLAKRTQAGGEDALPLRYFEGAAGGTVMLGTVPQTEDYQRCFDWPDATIEIPFEACDIMDRLAVLDADPERLIQARQRNVVHSLRRHDWIYRWQTILRAVGLTPPAGMPARIARLEQLADLVTRTAGAG